MTWLGVGWVDLPLEGSNGSSNNQQAIKGIQIHDVRSYVAPLDNNTKSKTLTRKYVGQFRYGQILEECTALFDWVESWIDSESHFLVESWVDSNQFLKKPLESCELIRINSWESHLSHELIRFSWWRRHLIRIKQKFSRTQVWTMKKRS